MFNDFDLNSLHDGFELIVLCPQFPVTFFHEKNNVFIIVHVVVIIHYLLQWMTIIWENSKVDILGQ